MRFLILLCALLLLPSLILSSTTGKLSGVVTDQSTGDPLIGVNVVIEGTTMGASTDIDGYYVILNVAAATYNVTFNYIGYRSVSVENVRVVPDITKRLDIGMEETTIELGEQIVVTAERPFFEASATNTVRVLDSEEIQKVPVKGVNQIVSLNAGVVMQDGSGGETDAAVLNVRGGRGNETLYVVDGIPFNDALFGNALGTIPDNAIEQVSSQLGGFSAKYGSAQSGVINIVTKSGNPKYFGSLEGISSSITDNYGYNAVNGSFGGPIIPGNKTYTFFLSGEYVSADDDNPRAVNVEIPATVGRDGTVFPEVKYDQLPYNSSELIRFVGKFDANYDRFKATLSFNGSLRDAQDFTQSYAKHNAIHNPIIKEDGLGTSLKLTGVIDQTTFIDFIARYRYAWHEEGDGVWFDQLDSYGDTLANRAIGVELRDQGARVLRDINGVYYLPGRAYNRYRKYETETFGADFYFTKQFKEHLIELGGTLQQDRSSFFDLSPLDVAPGLRTPGVPAEQRYYAGIISHWGYDLTGNEINSTIWGDVTTDAINNQTDFVEQSGPKKPILGSLYFQDKIEFADFIFNLGIRWDYFDPKSNRLRDPFYPLAFSRTGDPFTGELVFSPDTDTKLDPADYEEMPAESYISPRLGFAYPVTERTVFHAQYGVFRQFPRYVDLYDSWVAVTQLERDAQFFVNTGHLQAETTTQYEFGFKNQIGNYASLDITAFYKNVKGLTNTTSQQFKRGQLDLRYLSIVNSDFGTVKGFAFQFNLRRIGPLSGKIDYTFSLAEGTGSSQTSSYVAAFRNPRGEIPSAIAPLDFDQRHTLTASFDIRANRGQGPRFMGIRPLESTGANFLITYNSGRPYTPVESLNALDSETNYGALTQYVNSAYAAGIFRIDLKIDKAFYLGRITMVPYLWVQNVLDRDNFIQVWRSTGQPDNTAYLETPQGQLNIQSSGPGYASDYKAYERDPENYGTPRTIRLGLRVQF
ncbi:MAG: carboxypeptidase-like regulatory domain-containing protein [bacterium]|nr:MAG: carboxypeptidase-like regulatory domain-containing protein [bacterium]